MKRFLSALLSLVLVISLVPAAFATDIDKHWSKPYMEKMDAIGVINPNTAGNFTPDTQITRAEFMRYINRAFGFTEKAAISQFTDVKSDAWYYETIQIAVAYGYINGMSTTTMGPDGKLTREQAATIMGRLHKYTPTASSSALKFTDKAKISAYADNYVADAVALGYLNGYTDNTYRPQGNVTRGEIAKILYYYVGTRFGTAGGSYTAANLQNDTKNVTVSASCTLSNMTIPGNLYITEGAANAGVTLNNVTVTGRIIVSGGAVSMTGVKGSNMVVASSMGKPTVTVHGDTSINATEVKSGCSLSESSLGFDADGLYNITVDGDNAALTLDGAVNLLTVSKPATIALSNSSSVRTLTANAKTGVTGNGLVSSAVINVAGCTLTNEPSNITLKSGISANVAGKTVTSSSTGNNTDTTANTGITPASRTIDSGAMNDYYDFTVTGMSSKTLSSVKIDSTTLTKSTHYVTTSTGIRLYNDYLLKLSNGSHKLYVTFTDGTQGVATITIEAATSSIISPSKLTIDSLDDVDTYYSFTVSGSGYAADDITKIKYGSITLDEGSGKDYYVSSTKVFRIYGSFIEDECDTGTNTFTVYFGSHTETIRIEVDEDSSDDDLSVSPSTNTHYLNDSWDDEVYTISTSKTIKTVKIGSKKFTDWEEEKYSSTKRRVTLDSDSLDDFYDDEDLSTSKTYTVYFTDSNGDTGTAKLKFSSSGSSTSYGFKSSSYTWNGNNLTTSLSVPSSSTSYNISTVAIGGSTISSSDWSQTASSTTRTLTINQAALENAFASSTSNKQLRVTLSSGSAYTATLIYGTVGYNVSITVYDSNMVELPNATVTLTKGSTSYDAVANGSGVASFTKVPTGSYTISAKYEVETEPGVSTIYTQNGPSIDISGTYSGWISIGSFPEA